MTALASNNTRFWRVPLLLQTRPWRHRKHQPVKPSPSKALQTSLPSSSNTLPTRTCCHHRARSRRQTLISRQDFVPKGCIPLGRLSHGQKVRSNRPCNAGPRIGKLPRPVSPSLASTQSPAQLTLPQAFSNRSIVRTLDGLRVRCEGDSLTRAHRVAPDRVRHPTRPRDHLQRHPSTPRTLGFRHQPRRATRRRFRTVRPSPLLLPFFLPMHMHAHVGVW